MSYFRNLERVVASSLFSHPNSFFLQAAFRPIYLVSDSQPSIEHLHSVRPLFTTILALEPHAANPTYEKLVKKELAFLQLKVKNYSEAIAKFVSQGGLLTGEGIANIYFAADRLNLSAEWLEKNVHH